MNYLSTGFIICCQLNIYESLSTVVIRLRTVVHLLGVYATHINYIVHDIFPRWNTLVIDGHDVEAVCRAFFEAKTTQDRPTAILAKTYKGKGVPGTGKVSFLYFDFKVKL